MTKTTRLALTPGEPSGIGPELVVKIAQHHYPFELCAIADPELLATTAKTLALPLTIHHFDSAKPAQASLAESITVLPVPLSTPVTPGRLDASNAKYVIETLHHAAQGCMTGTFDGIVTGPVQKSVINDAGIPFSGHTEYFAEQSDTTKVVMMLATEGLRVSLATTHLPLRNVPDAITSESLTKTIDILLSDLKTKFGISQPTVLVCGLNPHAGENGHMGHEEIETITPVLDSFRKAGHKLVGPLPADTLFTPHHLNNADAVLAMYHDQGLPVLKHKGFGNAVNITLGLPFIRTSVDHGTALDIAGKGIADVGSLRVALDYAYELTKTNKQYINISKTGLSDEER